MVKPVNPFLINVELCFSEIAWAKWPKGVSFEAENDALSNACAQKRARVGIQSYGPNTVWQELLELILSVTQKAFGDSWRLP